MSNEANNVLQFLASMPVGHTTTTRAAVKELLLSTGGQMMACGSLYNIKAQHVGAGVYRVSLQRWSA